MRPLTAHDIVCVWERGLVQHPVDRALTLLGAGYPELSWDTLAGLGVGERDRLLIQLREATLGSALEGAADCPRCGELAEFALDTATIARTADADVATSAGHFSDADGRVWTYRSPSSEDLAAITECADVAAARTKLARRCLSAPEDKTAPSEEVIGLLAERLAAEDGQADILLDLTCGACGQAWQTQLDAAAFFWTEVATQAQRLMHEVAILAHAFGWREADVLAVGSARRRFYLELAGA